MSTEIYNRIIRYAGKARSQVSNPCLTANEAIELANEIAKIIAQRDELQEELSIAVHKVITCGVAANHPDASLSRRESDYGGKWDSPQAESVRILRAQRDELLALIISLREMSSIASKEMTTNRGDFVDWFEKAQAIAKAVQP